MEAAAAAETFRYIRTSLTRQTVLRTGNRSITADSRDKELYLITPRVCVQRGDEGGGGGQISAEKNKTNQISQTRKQKD